MLGYDKVAAHAAKIRSRFTVSLAAYAICALISFAVPAGATFNDPIVMVQLGLLIAALASLPRSTAPHYWPKPESDDERERLDVLRTELRDLELRFTKVRIVYFILVIPLLLLPALRG